MNLEELRDDILREMYAEAEPPADWDAIIEDPPDGDWYSEHVLDADRQQEIFEKHVEGADLTQREHASLTITCILDYGPRSTPK